MVKQDEFPWWLGDKEPACQSRRCWFNSWFWKIPLEKEMATHSNIPAWEIPRTEEPGRLQSMGSQRVGNNLMINKNDIKLGWSQNINGHVLPQQKFKTYPRGSGKAVEVSYHAIIYEKENSNCRELTEIFPIIPLRYWQPCLFQKNIFHI